MWSFIAKYNPKEQWKELCSEYHCGIRAEMKGSDARQEWQLSFIESAGIYTWTKSEINQSERPVRILDLKRLKLQAWSIKTLWLGSFKRTTCSSAQKMTFSYENRWNMFFKATLSIPLLFSTWNVGLSKEKKTRKFEIFLKFCQKSCLHDKYGKVGLLARPFIQIIV